MLQKDGRKVYALCKRPQRPVQNQDQAGVQFDEAATHLLRWRGGVGHPLCTYTQPGEVVVDFCAGSGTTAVAALNTGRRYICFETAPAIYAPALGRISKAREAVAGGGKGE